MEYRTTIQIETPIFVPCNRCKLWLPVESEHSCTGIIDTTINNRHITWSVA